MHGLRDTDCDAGGTEPRARVAIQLLTVPNCPLDTKMRENLDSALEKIQVTVMVEELVGEYSSPTLLINGVDATGRPLPTEAHASCRLDLPSEAQILQVIRSQMEMLSNGD